MRLKEDAAPDESEEDPVNNGKKEEDEEEYGMRKGRESGLHAEWDGKRTLTIS